MRKGSTLHRFTATLLQTATPAPHPWRWRRFISKSFLKTTTNYDVVGNVTQVYDRGTNGSSNFDHIYTYDSPDRLTNWAMTGSSTDGQSYTYSAIGNLTSKTGVGTMSYGSHAGWGCTATTMRKQPQLGDQQ